MTGNELLEQLLYIQEHYPLLLEKQVFGRFRNKKTVDTVYKLLSPVDVGKVTVKYKSSQYGVQTITPTVLNDLVKTDGFNQSSIQIEPDGRQTALTIEEANVLFL